jgi:hypothetical protein
MIEAGAVEGAHAEVAEDTQVPAGSSDEFGEYLFLIRDR